MNQSAHIVVRGLRLSATSSSSTFSAGDQVTVGTLENGFNPAIVGRQGRLLGYTVSLGMAALDTPAGPPLLVHPEALEAAS